MCGDSLVGGEGQSDQSSEKQLVQQVGINLPLKDDSMNSTRHLTTANCGSGC